MRTYSSEVTVTDTAIIETGAIHLSTGASIVNLGAHITSELVTAYVKPETCLGDAGILTLWDGTPVGTYTTVSTWHRATADYGRCIMRSIRATINYGPAKGVYHGRFNDDWSQLVNLRRYN